MYAPIGSVVLGVLLAACDEPLTPIVGTERLYTLYGVFTPSRDTQSVVVIPIRDRLDPGAPSATIDAQVRSLDLTTGEMVTWQDSLVLFDDPLQRKPFNHVYWAHLRAVPLHTYRIEVERSDGKLTLAEALVPPKPDPVVEAPRLFGQSLANQRVVWLNTKRLLNVVVSYTVRTAKEIRTIDFPYESEQEGNQSIVEIDLSADFNAFTHLMNDGVVSLDTLQMYVFSVNEAWNPPGGVFDYDLLAQPGTFSNVENGFGFVGGATEGKVGWRPDEEILRRIGFTSFGRRQK